MQLFSHGHREHGRERTKLVLLYRAIVFALQKELKSLVFYLWQWLEKLPSSNDVERFGLTSVRAARKIANELIQICNDVLGSFSKGLRILGCQGLCNECHRHEMEGTLVNQSMNMQSIIVMNKMVQGCALNSKMCLTVDTEVYKESYVSKVYQYFKFL